MAIEVSVLKVLFAAIIGYLVSIIWYQPFLFGAAWFKTHKFSKKEQENRSTWQAYGLGFIGTFIAAWVIAVAIMYWGVTDIGGASIVALILWLGISVTTTASFVLWGRETQDAYLIHSLHTAVQYVIMASIMAA